MFEVFNKLAAFPIALGLLAGAVVLPSELFNRPKSGPSSMRIEKSDAQTTPPAVFTAGGFFEAESVGQSSNVLPRESYMGVTSLGIPTPFPAAGNSRSPESSL